MIYSPLNVMPFAGLTSLLHIRKINRLAKRFFVSKRKTILWVYHVQIKNLDNYLKNLDYDFLIYDCVDNYEGFPEDSALQCVSAMLGMEFTEITDETKDAIGEITNIIVGGAKNLLYEEGIYFNISTPTVIAGKDYSVYSGASTMQTIICYVCNDESFFIEFCIKKED